MILKDNIKLCPISLEDINSIYNRIRMEKEYLRVWLPFVDLTTNIEFTKRYVEDAVKGGELQFSLYDGNEFIGLVGFNNFDEINKKAEIGYWISEKYQGMGIVTLSVTILLEQAFNKYNLNSVRIKVAVNNTKSRKIPEKLGFTLEGIERAGELLVDNNFTDLVIYSLLRNEFIKNEYNYRKIKIK